MIGTSSLEVSPKPFLLIRLILSSQFTRNSKINESEVDRTIAFYASTYVFQLEVTVGMTLLMDNLHGSN